MSTHWPLPTPWGLVICARSSALAPKNCSWSLPQFYSRTSMEKVMAYTMQTLHPIAQRHTRMYVCVYIFTYVWIYLCMPWFTSIHVCGITSYHCNSLFLVLVLYVLINNKLLWTRFSLNLAFISLVLSFFCSLLYQLQCPAPFHTPSSLARSQLLVY